MSFDLNEVRSVGLGQGNSVVQLIVAVSHDSRSVEGPSRRVYGNSNWAVGQLGEDGVHVSRGQVGSSVVVRSGSAFVKLASAVDSLVRVKLLTAELMVIQKLVSVSCDTTIASLRVFCLDAVDKLLLGVEGLDLGRVPVLNSMSGFKNSGRRESPARSADSLVLHSVFPQMAPVGWGHISRGELCGLVCLSSSVSQKFFHVRISEISELVDSEVGLWVLPILFSDLI
eukprot:CAMPEP_0168342760 /NCGR_PEP_ID=MMETSP0213-20121227/15604_1 /TAXON_ID=151035 /ORGANISM="Euplotes harpa, Strain FSP1.4" /LENGTH=226 /DNA_ID=CAMNT_0008349755 /DNA_START=137 /DNA_END=818 /DNA_ORIENTATION=-